MECSICEENYNENEKKPYLLSPCGHCFCLSCTDQLIDRSCPMCRTYVESKTLNRGLLDLLNGSKMRPKTVIIRESKIFESFEKLFTSMDELKNSLKLKLDEKFKQSSELVQEKQEEIENEMSRKASLLHSDREKLLAQLSEYEKSYNKEVSECVSLANVEAEVSEFERDFSKLNLNELNERSNKIQKMLHRKMHVLEKIKPLTVKFDGVTEREGENRVGKITVNKELIDVSPQNAKTNSPDDLCPETTEIYSLIKNNREKKEQMTKISFNNLPALKSEVAKKERKESPSPPPVSLESKAPPTRIIRSARKWDQINLEKK